MKSKKCAELNKATRQKLLTTLTEYEMEVKELGGYHVAMVTTGGVSIKRFLLRRWNQKKSKQPLFHWRSFRYRWRHRWI